VTEAMFEKSMSKLGSDSWTVSTVEQPQRRPSQTRNVSYMTILSSWQTTIVAEHVWP